MKYHFSPFTMAIIKKTISSISKTIEKLKPLYTAGENSKWKSHLGNQFGPFFKKLNTNLPYDPAILLLGIYPREMKIYVHTKTHT